MSVVIIGGNECMVRQYKDLGREYSCLKNRWKRKLVSISIMLQAAVVHVFLIRDHITRQKVDIPVN